MTELFDLHESMIDSTGTLRFVLRLGIDLFFASIVTFAVYMKRYGRNEYLFTYIMFNVITFTLCFSLRQVPIELGFALGLFAVFGILRYRTDPIRIHDLTYLFIVIGIGIFIAVANNMVSLSELLLVNTVVTGLTALLENGLKLHQFSSMNVLYDDLTHLQTSKEDLLLDIRSRTGKDVHRFTINQIDLLRETVDITIYFREES